MSYFTVYHGNNEATMFNADCTTGSLVSRMLQLLLPHNAPYTRLELVPLSFVYEHFRPPISRGSTSTGTRGGGVQSSQSSPSQQQQQQDVNNNNNNNNSDGMMFTVVKGPPFTGVIPLIGLATRPVESYADALFTAATNIIPSSTATAAAAAVGVPSMLGSTSSSSFGPPMPLQNCFVLLGCRHFHEQRSNGNGTTTTSNTTTTTINNVNNVNNMTATGKLTPIMGRKSGNAETVLKEQQAAALLRAQMIAAAPVITQNTQSGLPSNSNRAPTPQPQGGMGSSSSSGGGGGGIGSGVVATAADCAQLTAYKHGIMPTDKSTAPWRKAFSQYLTTMLQPTISTDGNPNACTSPNNHNNNTDTSPHKQNDETISTTTASQQQQQQQQQAPSPSSPSAAAAAHSLEESQNRAVLLPPAATGIFNMPIPPITGYDVLWRGTSGEHIRLQEALDERVITDTDTKKKKPKRA
ncbi:uncharacterized protein TM35_000391450 [Trypanosoma theileri]|uniref:Uncharacterized protein n=1 Tax=Trypanosoma theileri TaxID=67003 RepID=A0A1X0NK52_9TRYP|nr:uncharacterized protein TM35_000391450 [Trypanosoma theileri]ORC84971.1 hypothetical protein TM35_000391450 [Trypanosoma theileri]